MNKEEIFKRITEMENFISVNKNIPYDEIYSVFIADFEDIYEITDSVENLLDNKEISANEAIELLNKAFNIKIEDRSILKECEITMSDIESILSKLNINDVAKYTATTKPNETFNIFGRKINSENLEEMLNLYIETEINSIKFKLIV